MPYINDTLAGAKNLFDNYTPAFPTGLVAPEDLRVRQGREMTGNAAVSMLPEVADWTQRAYAEGLQQNNGDVSNNPFLQGAASAAIKPIYDNLTERVLPALRTGAVQGGTAGGSRQALAEGIATRDASTAAANATTSMFGNAWQAQQGNRLGLLSAAPTVQGVQAAPGQVLQSVGQSATDYAQKQADAEVQRQQFDASLPYNKLTEYINAVGRSYGGQGTSEVQAPQTPASTQIIGAAASILPLIGPLLKTLGIGG